MSLTSNHLPTPHLSLCSPFAPPPPPHLRLRLLRRRRLKTRPRLILRNQLGPLLPSIESLFQTLLSQFPSVNSLDLIAPALGFASGAALFLTRFNSTSVSDAGEWILFTSPTPFNRFVILRCPSISFEGSELLEDVNERLVKEDRHFVRLNTGRIYVEAVKDDAAEQGLCYQRVCIGTDDGGVISLDWPANLDLREEHGFDTTLLLIPGTPEGSMDKNIRSFVSEALKHGFFPVVMNPRGCAASPLTTPRLFTAADSDDICTAVQFITRARSWTTMMGVGWGYGANMLTKYLAEVGENTPFTAATCIDNPFDLEEVTRSSPHHIAVDQKLTDGLINILRTNKALFQGRKKGFDVEKALRAKSVRDFEEAISMVSYGFDTIEDFYSKSSTRGVVGSVKVPVLFIQNDHGAVPLFSVPRVLIAENPYTSLLLCSCSQSKATVSGEFGVYWCQHLTIEWLTAVELGLLKGRHPLLKDVDVTINPSKGLSLVESGASDKNSRADTLLNLSQLNALNGYSVDPIKGMLEGSDTSASMRLPSEPTPQKYLEVGEKGLQQADSGELHQTSSANSDLVEGTNPEDTETGQVQQTARVVMNMLDITMPDTLTEEEKKQVLTAVGRGETVLKALQDAVPEDVRGKLTTALSGILCAKGTNINLNGPLGNSQIPNLSPGMSSKVPDRVPGTSNTEGWSTDSSDMRKTNGDHTEGPHDHQPGMEKLAGGTDSDFQQSAELNQFHSNGADVSSLNGKTSNELGNNHDTDELLKEKSSNNSDPSENGSDTGAKLNWSDKAIVSSEATVDLNKVDQDGKVVQLDLEDNTMHRNDDLSNKVTPPTKTEEPPPAPSVSSSEATFSVSQAFDALTGMDDSTQLAVNSVFGVIEDMITQLEERDNENESNDRNEGKDERTGSVSEKLPIVKDHNLEKTEENKNDQIPPSDIPHDPPIQNIDAIPKDSHDTRTGRVEGHPTQNHRSSHESGYDSHQEKTAASNAGEGKDGKEVLFYGKLLTEKSDKLRNLNEIPLQIATNPYGNSLYNQCLSNYLRSKIANAKALDIDTTTALFLDYFPEEGQWRLLEQPGVTRDSTSDFTSYNGVERRFQGHSAVKANDATQFIEPPYVILDTGKQPEPVREYKIVDRMNGDNVISDDRSMELMLFVKKIIFDSLKVEVSRRINTVDKAVESNLVRDMEQVANAVSLAIGLNKEHTWSSEDKNSSVDYALKGVGTLNGELIMSTVSFSVRDTSYLRRVLPVGVTAGTTLAALRKFFNVTSVHDNGLTRVGTLDRPNSAGEKIHGHEQEAEVDQSSHPANAVSRHGEEVELENLNKDTIMVSAVTAALGASALLVHQQETFKDNGTEDSSSRRVKEKGNYEKEPDSLEETMSEKNQSNFVTSLAEKAMSVAGPVVPTKEDGEVDHQRLVAMLADLGQKGGMLKLVGKVALLWGGVRGAISLTDKLISFLRVAERPLFLRIIGFSGMVMVLWSPIVVPLFPTLVRSWATHNPSRITELACIIGLYVAVTILVVLWGKRIRGYEDALEQYGLDLTSLPKFQNFLIAMGGGVMLVLSIHYVNALLGCVSLSWPSTLPVSSFDPLTWLKVYGKMMVLVVQGVVTATGIALVEELLFRSWFLEEIAVDLGYYRGIIISGLAFSLFQRSAQAIPGVWLLSLALAGLRQRNQGSLSIPIGLRAGIMASSFILQTGGFLRYEANLPVWLSGSSSFQPFSGAVGFVFALVLAIVLYPNDPLYGKNIRTIHE